MIKKIKLFDPSIDKNEEKAVLKTLRSRYWASGSGIGEVSKFEERFRKHIGSNYCIAVNSGTAALHLALSSIDIKNKEVILPSFTFASTAHAVIYNGGKPVFADILSDTLCIDPNSVKKKANKKTKVILPVHYAGMPCELDKLKIICEQHDALLIEDAAHAIDSIYKKRKIGTWGFAGCFSFHPIKNLAMPSGGAITINEKNERLVKIIKSKRWCGISDRRDNSYDVKHIGWNYYMNEFSASIGLIQLSKIKIMNNKRKKIAKRYNKELSIENKMKFNSNCSYHMYWVLLNNRKEFIKKMSQSGIETGTHYRPVHKMTYYRNNTKLPITERIGQSIVTLPIHPNLTNNDIDYIIKQVNKFC